eukprot:5716114-Prymnesium_polylepis.1
MARHAAFQMNLANTPHFDGSQYQWLLPKNRQYVIDLRGSSPQTAMMRLEEAALEVGQALGPDDWIELETCQLGAYKVGNGGGIDTRPVGSLPDVYTLSMFDGVTYTYNRPKMAAGRRLSTAVVTFDEVREAHRVRLSGRAACYAWS